MDIVEQTMRRAARASGRDGRLRFVVPTYNGPRIALRRVEFQDCMWTNGQNWGTWDAHAASGITRGCVPAELTV